MYIISYQVVEEKASIKTLKSEIKSQLKNTMQLIEENGKPIIN